MQIITTSEAPLPAGHYSQAVACQGLLFISGQLPIHPELGKLQGASAEEQARQVLQNMSAIAIAAGTDLNNTVKTTVFISDIQLWDQINDVYANFFGDHRPARAIVPTRELHFGFLVEMEAIIRL